MKIKSMKRLPLYFTLVIFISPLWGQTALFQPLNSNFFIFKSGTRQFVLHQSRLRGTSISKSFAKLSTGKRINVAADDAAGLAVVEKMNAMVKGLKQDAMNSHDYKNYLRHVEGTIGQNYNILKRVRQVILKSANGILGPDDRQMNQAEIDQLIAQINMNARFGQFNKKQIVSHLTARGLGLDKVNVVKNLHGSMPIVEKAMKKLRRQRAVSGIKENTLTLRIKGKMLYLVNMTASMSRSGDADMAAEMAKLSKNGTLYQTAQGALMLSNKK